MKTTIYTLRQNDIEEAVKNRFRELYPELDEEFEMELIVPIMRLHSGRSIYDIKDNPCGRIFSETLFAGMTPRQRRREKKLLLKAIDESNWLTKEDIENLTEEK